MSFSLFASFGFWRLPASAADLKFLHCPLRVRNRNFNRKADWWNFKQDFKRPSHLTFRSLEAICALA